MGDGDPVDVVEIGSAKLNSGCVYSEFGLLRRFTRLALCQDGDRSLSRS